jgi:hypothetical protein
MSFRNSCQVLGGCGTSGMTPFDWHIPMLRPSSLMRNAPLWPWGRINRNRDARVLIGVDSPLQ